MKGEPRHPPAVRMAGLNIRTDPAIVMAGLNNIPPAQVRGLNTDSGTSPE